MASKKRLRAPLTILLGGFAIGLIPAATSFVLDPFDLVGRGPDDRKVRDRVEKRHGPLFKTIAYDANPKSVVVLGDSRARALRDKLFHELGRKEVFNLAYGGGTIPEVVDSYWFAASRRKLDAVVIGAPLRMFDEKYKNGKNQVPEALAIVDRPLSYFSSWLVFDTALQTIGLRAPEIGDGLSALASLAIGSAKADALNDRFGGFGQCRAACLDAFSDPVAHAPQPKPERNHVIEAVRKAGADRKAANRPIAIAGDLPPKWRRQIEKNAASDWRRFRYSERYLDDVRRVADHAKANGARVLFFIPPTPVEMQQRIVDFDRLAESVSHRRRLAGIAPVLDFDSPNEMTAKRELFSDAYHFTHVLAKKMAQEISLRIAPHDERTRKLVTKRRKGVSCPQDDPSGMAIGEACIVWSTPR